MEQHCEHCRFYDKDAFEPSVGTMWLHRAFGSTYCGHVHLCEDCFENFEAGGGDNFDVCCHNCRNNDLTGEYH